ncbi:LAGLIDADG family homing endonuclease [Streptomyces sp. NPDC090085]|uniref:LAGLIDADG family homing endonuclease n=1 Tax=Streptomyces sp. NPDC090085 TaxID=3365943 RepID=UPI003812C666
MRRAASLLRLAVDPAALMDTAGYPPDDWQADFLRQAADGNGFRGLLLTARQAGKALAVDTMLPCPAGWVRLGEVRAGQPLFDERGRLCVVRAAHPVEVTACYRVTFSDGTHLDASGAHEWTVLDPAARDGLQQQFPAGPPESWAASCGARTLTTAQLDRAGLRTRQRSAWSIPTCGPLDLPARALPLDPWCLGYWLGNGRSREGRVTAHCEDADEVAARYRQAGFEVRTVPADAGRCAVDFRVHGLTRVLRTAGVLGDKRVPAAYLRASAAQRLALLQGLMDSDGGPGAYGTRRSVCEWSNKREALVEAFADLARGLGFKPRIRQHRARYNGKDYGPAWRLYLTPHVQPFTLARKAAQWTADRAQGARPFCRTVRTVTAIERLPDQPTRCLTVSSPSGLFLAGEGMIPTHNSTTLASLAVWHALVRPRRDVLVISNTLRQSSEIIHKVRGIVGHLDIPLKREAQTFVTLFNGGRIIALAGKGHIRGMTGGLVMIDEAAFLHDEVVHASVLPFLASVPGGGTLVCASSAGGETGFFWQWFTQGGDTYQRWRIPYTDVPRLTEDNVMALKSAMPRTVWASEMLCDFSSSGGGVWLPSLVEAAFVPESTIPLQLPTVPAIDWAAA